MPVELLNKETKKIESVPNEQVVNALNTGLYQARPTDLVDMYDPSGNIVSTPVFELRNKMQEGFRVEEEGLKQIREERAQFEGRPLASFLAGGARMGTLGLSDFLAPKGLQETMQGLEEYNPTASTVGEYTLGLAPLLLGGAGVKAGGAVAKGIGGLARAAPISILSKAGRAVEQGLTGKAAAKGLAGQILERAVPKAAGFGVEGAGFAAGNLISEASLGNVDLTAENVTAQIGLGALLGGGLGVLAGGAGVVLPKALQRVRGGLDKIGPEEGLLRSVWEKGVVPLAEKVSTKPVGDVRQAMTLEPSGVAWRDLAYKSPSERKALTKDFVNLVTTKADNLDSYVSEAFSGKLPEIEKMLEGVSKEEAAKKIVPQMVDWVGNLMNLRAEPEIYTERGLIGIIEKHVKRFQETIPEILKNPKKNAYDLYNELNLVKKTIGDELYPKEVSGLPRAISANEMRTYTPLRKIHNDSFRLMLESPEIWGGPAGEIQQQMNAAYTKYKNARTTFLETSNFGKSRRTKGGSSIRYADPVKVESFVKQMDTIKGDVREKVLSDYLDAMEEVVQNFENVSRKDISSASESLQASLKSIGKEKDFLNKIVSAQRQAHTLNYGARGGGETMIELGAQTVGAGIGGMLAGGWGAVAGASLARGLSRAVTNPGKTAELLHYTLEANRGAASAIRKSVSGFMGVATKGARKSSQILKPAIRPAAINSLLKFYPQDKKEKDQGKALDALGTRLAELQSNPKMVDQMMQSEGLVDVPQLRKALKKTLMNKIKFTSKVMPKNPHLANPMLLGLRKWEPSSEEMAKFNAYVEAINDPMSVIDDFEKGVLSMEGIEALKETSPETFIALQKEVMEQATDLKEELPYEKRLVLSQLFDVPIESSLDPFNYNYLQQGYVDKMMGEEQVTQEMKKNIGSGASLNLASREKTDVEQFTDRNRG